MFRLASSKALTSLLAITLSSFAFAQGHSSAASDEWTKLGPTTDNTGDIYLSHNFSQKTGKFDATPESFLDKQDSVEGTFLVGTYRMVMNAPIKDEQGVDYDELIGSEVMDCKSDYFGRLRTVEKLKGKVVRDETTPDGSIMMVQTHDWTIDGQLCRLHQGEVPSPQ